MKKRMLLRIAAMALALCGVCPMAGAEEPPRDRREIIEELVTGYGQDGETAPQTEALLAELREADPAAADRWERILALWGEVRTGLVLCSDVLPDGLPDTEELCIVVLGYQLNPDGSMRDELFRRLRVALDSAEKYPRAFVACTGGGTASRDSDATEAGMMAEWLAASGVARERIIVEDRSLTTAQNALYTCSLLLRQYPEISKLAIVTSDYHIETGVLLFGAEGILLAEEPGRPKLTVVANAACAASARSFSAASQGRWLLTLARETDAAGTGGLPPAP